MKLKVTYLISISLLVIIVFSLLHSKRNTIERFVQLMGDLEIEYFKY